MGLLNALGDKFKKKSLFDDGVEYMKHDKYGKALKCFDKALKIDSNDVRSWVNRGLTLEKLNRHEEGLESFDKALKLDPKDITVWFIKAITLKKIGKYHEALNCFDKALELDPNLEAAKKAKEELLSSMQNELP